MQLSEGIRFVELVWKRVHNDENLRPHQLDRPGRYHTSRSSLYEDDVFCIMNQIDEQKNSNQLYLRSLLQMIFQEPSPEKFRKNDIIWISTNFQYLNQMFIMGFYYIKLIIQCLKNLIYIYRRRGNGLKMHTLISLKSDLKW